MHGIREVEFSAVECQDFCGQFDERLKSAKIAPDQSFRVRPDGCHMDRGPAPSAFGTQNKGVAQGLWPSPSEQMHRYSLNLRTILD